MEQIKQIKTEKFEGLAVLVPDGNEYWIDSKITKFIHIGHIEGDAYTIELPFVCHYIAESTDLTEERCTDIVDRKNWGYRHYWNDNGFVPRGFNHVYRHAKESFASLMQSLEANTGTWIILKKI